MVMLCVGLFVLVMHFYRILHASVSCLFVYEFLI